MRALVLAAVAVGVLSLTSCSEPKSASSKADKSNAKRGNVESRSATNDSSTGGHAHDSGETGEHGAGDHGAGDHGAGEHGAHKGHGNPHAKHGHAGASETKLDESKKIAIGEKVPDFEVTIDGKKWKLSELQKNAAMTENGTLVLTFWCSFCHSCRHVEHPLDALAKQYQGKVGVIAVDSSAGETTEGVAEFAKEEKLSLPIALDGSGAAADIFGTRVTTTTVVIDKSGVLRYRGQFGDAKKTFAHDALQSILAGKDVAVEETRQKG